MELPFDDDRPISVVLAEASVAVLVEMLGDAADGVRESIVAALGTKRNPDAAPRLIEILLHDPVGEIREKAATALGKIGAPSSIPALGQAVRDPEALVAYEAVLLRRGDSFVMRATPRLDGFEFNPPSARIRFCEPWHRLDFRLRAEEGRLHQASNGHVSVTISGAGVADIPISIYVGPDRHDTEVVAQTRPPYRSVFFSYSHLDVAVVKRVERAAER